MDPLATDLLPALRRYLNLTQPRMAELLRISRVALAAAECGTRRLPAPGRTQLQAIVAALPAAVAGALLQKQLPAAPPVPAAAQPPDPATLARRRQRLRQEIARLDEELSTSLTNTARGQARLALLAAPAPPDLGEQSQLFEQEAQAWTGPIARAEQTLLAARLAGLQRELALVDAATG